MKYWVYTKASMGTYLWHDFSKAYQYDIINEIFYRNLKNISIKTTEVDL